MRPSCASKRENRKKRDNDDQQTEKERRTDLFGRVDEDLAAFRLCDGGRVVFLAFGQMPIAVFDITIDASTSKADREGEASQRHDVRGDAKQVNGKKRNQDRDGEGIDCDQRRPEVEEENHDDHADNHGFFEQVSLQGLYRRIDQIGAVYPV